MGGVSALFETEGQRNVREPSGYCITWLGPESSVWLRRRETDTSHSGHPGRVSEIPTLPLVSGESTVLQFLFHSYLTLLPLRSHTTGNTVFTRVYPRQKEFLGIRRPVC